MSNTWFRMYSEFATDPKVQRMPEIMQRRLVMIFCLRCSNNLETLHETDIAFALRITDEEMAETKKLFLEKSFIDDQWNLLHWDKRQYEENNSTQRVREWRKKKKQLCNKDETLHETDEILHETQMKPQSRAEQQQESKKVNLPLTPPLPVDNFSKPNGEKKGSLKIENDFAAAAAACCAIIQRRKLSPVDETILLKWCETYDFEKFVKPLLIDRVTAFSKKNLGKRPASLSYFAPAIREHGG